MVNVSSNYEYITNAQKSIIESNIPEKLSIIQDNLLEFKLLFESGEWARGELERISRELESMGKYFIEQHGLVETRALLNGMHAEVYGNKIEFFNNARNSRGQFYAGHHEYGYYARNGKFIEARPFMRPALFAVSKASQGDFANILSELARGVFRADGTGYQGLNNLNFGHQLGTAHSFSKPTNIIRRRIGENYHADYLDKQTRNPYSIRRGRNDSLTNRKREDVGLGKNRRNFNKANEYNRSRSMTKSRIVSSKRSYSLTKRNFSKKEIYREKNLWRAQDGYQDINRDKVQRHQFSKFNNMNIEKVGVVRQTFGERRSYSKEKSNIKFTTKKRN